MKITTCWMGIVAVIAAGAVALPQSRAAVAATAGQRAHARNAQTIKPVVPVQFFVTVPTTTASGSETAGTYVVPKGKVLLIEFVSASYTQQVSDDFVHAAFSIDNGPQFAIPMTNQTGRGSGYDFLWDGAEQTHVYARANQKVNGVAIHQLLILKGADVTITFSGELLPAK